MRKFKLLSIITMLSLSIGLLESCGSEKTKEEVYKPEQKIEYSEPKEEKKEQEIPITLEELEFVNAQFEVDCIGSCYFKTQIKNNSKYNIVYLSYSYEIDNGEKTYLMMTDGLPIGGTSSLSECFGVSTQNFEDMKLVNLEITYLDDQNIKHYMEYDGNLNLYNVYD